MSFNRVHLIYSEVPLKFDGDDKVAMCQKVITKAEPVGFSDVTATRLEPEDCCPKCKEVSHAGYRYIYAAIAGQEKRDAEHGVI